MHLKIAVLPGDYIGHDFRADVIARQDSNLQVHRRERGVKVNGGAEGKEKRG